ncbi:hypothetical protein [Xanthomonas oryzae]|uniref:hypothetical protein n=1 Tax=Xanthomonas oryzae TaxID=347 RepID=UPI00349EA16F
MFILYVIQVGGMANPEYYVKRALVLDAGVYFQSDNPRRRPPVAQAQAHSLAEGADHHHRPGPLGRRLAGLIDSELIGVASVPFREKRSGRYRGRKTSLKQQSETKFGCSLIRHVV